MTSYLFSIRLKRSVYIGLGDGADLVCTFINPIHNKFKGHKNDIVDDRHFEDHLECFWPKILNINDISYIIFFTEFCRIPWTGQRGNRAINYIWLFSLCKIFFYISPPYLMTVKSFKAYICFVYWFG